jgi:hypothetical protein
MQEQTMQTHPNSSPFFDVKLQLQLLRKAYKVQQHTSTTCQELLTPSSSLLPRPPASNAPSFPPTMVRTLKTAPTDYTTPPFPSLYEPVHAPAGKVYYLYYASDIWRFTLYWTLIIYGAVHLAAVLCAVTMQWRNWKLVWGVPVIYGVVGSLEAVLAGSVVGLV